MENIIEAIRTEIENGKARSAWDKGVKTYALEMLEGIEKDVNHGYRDEEELQSWNIFRKAALNGAHDWAQYSEGGCALIYNRDIAERLCNPSELKRTDYGRRDPNSHETWIECQARALSQAENLLAMAHRKVTHQIHF